MALRFEQMNGNNGGFLRYLLDSRKLLALTLLGLSAIVLWGLNAVKNELEVNISSELQTILQSTRANLTLWNQEKSSQVNNWANNPNVRANVLFLAGLAESREINSSVFSKTRELAELRKILGPVCNRHNYVGFVVFDRTGMQIGALLNKPVGQRQLIGLSDFVKRSMEGETVVSLPFVNETPLPTIHGQWKEQWPTMFISAPVRDYSGEVVAVLAFRLRPEIEFSRITEIGRTGVSGETYAFDANGFLLSNSRFENQLREMGALSEDPDQMSMLNVRLIERGKHFNKGDPRLILSVQSAIKGESGMNTRGYPDYRGVKVVGVWTWLEEYNFGLATEIGLNEAFAPLLIMERVFIAFFVLLLVAVGTFRILSKRELKVEKEREKVSGLLKDSEKKANLILNAVGDGIYGIDTKGVTTFINPSAARMLGYSPQELIGKPQHSLIHHTHLDGTPYSQEECPIYAAFKDGQVYSVNDEVFWRKDGTSFPVEYVSTPIYENRKLNGAVITFKDITEKKQVENLANRMGRILDDSFDEIYIFDAQNFKYIQVNRGACENLGYTQKELLQLNAFDIFPEFGRQRFEKLVKPLRLGSAPRIVFETEQKRKDDSSYPVEVRLQLTIIDNSTLFLAIAHDITERKRAEQAQLQAQNQLEERVQQRTVELKSVNETLVEEIAEKKQAQEALERMMRQNELILKSVGDGIFGVNREGEIIFYNPSALKMLRVKDEELTGKSLHQILNLLHENDSQENLDYPLYQVFNDGQTQTKDEEVFWRKDGSALLAEYICAPIYEDERIVGAVITFRDILRRKRAEEALLQAKELAEQANRAKSDFLSRMSHELRTPMNSILGFAQILELDTLDALTERQKPWVHQVRKAGDHLLELINEILDLSRIESGKMTVSMENVDVVSLLKEVLILVLPMTKERKIKIVNRIPVPSLMVFADRIRLKQVLLNLLSNAVKYNIESGLISIYYRIGEGGRIRISIEDSGIGFAQDRISELFEPFSRLDADHSGVQGTGIGLTITRRLIEQMRGDIFVESVPGKGSCFTLELAPGKGPEQNPISDDSGLKAEPNSINPDKSYTLLCIEDNPDNLILIRQVLKAYTNIHLITSTEGKAGIELALAHHPDLILMDVHLPGMDGFTALKALRSYQETQFIPVVAVSANAMDEDVEIGMAAGFDAYITKPINVVHLMEVVGNLLETNLGASLKVSRR